jgi:hypothetical protein
MPGRQGTEGLFSKIPSRRRGIPILEGSSLSLELLAIRSRSAKHFLCTMKSLVPRFTGCCLVLLLLTLESGGCSFAFGYFHQVTQFKGKVVGRSLSPVQFRWLRRMFSVAGAELTLYDYKDPFHWAHRPPAIAQTKTNSAGEFEFKAVKEGHYTLLIEGSGFVDSFDVEVTSKVPPTAWITIDVSPTSPDCSGGHQFEVRAARK